ncbi:MAG TPA: SDR family oxidoreductase, partial [Cyclobacteriaceae bacterium]|nr:SDR family oxidoreductase [Cyclobacteriaceae bacterium]
MLVLSGGTRGIGLAVNHKFASGGFDIITCSRSREDLEKFSNDIRDKHPECRLYTLVADLSDREGVQQFSEFIQETGRPVDVLVNNAGIFMPGQVHNEPDGVLEKLMNVNVFSAYHLCRAVTPGMIARRSGHIFNMCSTASITAYVNGGSYCISKFALYGLTRVLREELKTKGIRVTAVLPGATLTSSWEGTELPPDRFMDASD